MTHDESRTHADEQIVDGDEQTTRAPSRPRVIIPLTLDRRTFVRGGGASVAAAALGRSASGQDIRDDDVPGDPVTHLADQNFPDVMDRPDQVPSPNTLQSLSPHEAETVDALTSRIMPGTPDDPGAHEAGVVTYIDALLAYHEGYAEFTYLQGPFAQTEVSLASAVPGASGTPAATPQGSPQASPVAGGGPHTIEVSAEEYAYQPSSFTVRPGDTIRMTNNGTLQHDMAVEEWGDEAIIPLLDPGDSDEYTLPDDVEAGSTVTFYCTVPGHRELGMEGTMSIAAASATPVAAGATPVATPGALAATPGMADAREPGYDVVMVDKKEIQRYGYQSRLSPRDVYRTGITALDQYTSNRFGSPFKELDADQQDQVIGDMAKGNISAFAPGLSAQSFFQNLRRHTAEGMFSDPAYGGNRDMVGWKLIGFPGAQRAYMPIEFQTEGTDREPQSMDQLHPFNPGEAGGHEEDVILPVSGSDREHKDEDHP